MLLLSPALSQIAQAQEPAQCEDALAVANEHFLFGRFDRASGLLEGCLKQDAFSEQTKTEVYKLLVQIYDAKGLAEQVKTTLAALLALSPNYEPDPEDPPSFIQLVEAFKRELEAQEPPNQPPPAAFSVSCTDLQCAFSDRSSDPDGSIVMWRWDFGDGNTSSQQNPSHTYTSGGTYVVTLSVTDDDDAAADTSQSVTVTSLVVALALAQAHGEVVRNVQLEQEDGRVVVSYDLTGTAKKYNVDLLLSTDGGQNFQPLPLQVTGDVGKGIRPGAGKEIVWMVLDDFPEGLAGEQYRLQVAAKKQGGKGLLYLVGGAIVAGGGATVALLLGGSGENGDPPPDPPSSGIPTPPGRPGGN